MNRQIYMVSLEEYNVLVSVLLKFQQLKVRYPPYQQLMIHSEICGHTASTGILHCTNNIMLISKNEQTSLRLQTDAEQLKLNYISLVYL